MICNEQQLCSLICSSTYLQRFSYGEIIDDWFYKNYRWSDDHWKKSSPTILTDHPTITLIRFWKLPSKNYRWSNDNFSVFLLNSTNDPTITFLFVCRTLTMIRRSQFVFLLNTTDDPTITNWFLLMIRRPSSTIRRSSLPALLDPTIIKYFSQQKYYRWSDDQKKSFYLWSSDHPSKGSTIWIYIILYIYLS